MDIAHEANPTQLESDSRMANKFIFVCQNIHLLEAGESTESGPMVTVECSHCGRSFSRRQAAVDYAKKTGKLLFCGMLCSAQGQRRKKPTMNTAIAPPKPEGSFVVCSCCKQEFHITPRRQRVVRQRGSTRIFCSRACANRHRGK